MTNTNDALICFILDKSGSMTSVNKATCDGFNQFVADQKSNPGEAYLTLTLFDTAFDVRYVGTALNDVPDLGTSVNSYIPSGMTALFDAVGEAVKATEKWVDSNSWTGRVMVVILTDGQENSSNEWHINNPRVENDAMDVAGLIDWKQKEGWDFIFLGAGGTEWLERTFHTLLRSNFYAYAGDSGSTAHAHALLSNAVTRSRAGGQSLADSISVANQDAN